MNYTQPGCKVTPPTENEIADVLDTAKQFQKATGHWGSCKALFEFVAHHNQFLLGSFKSKKLYKDGAIKTEISCVVDPGVFSDCQCENPHRGT